MCVKAMFTDWETERGVVLALVRARLREYRVLATEVTEAWLRAWMLKDEEVREGLYRVLAVIVDVVERLEQEEVWLGMEGS